MTTELWISIGALLSLALLILWWPFAKKNQLEAQSKNARSRANTQSYRVSLEKLDVQFSEARMEQQEYDELKAELGRKLLQDEAQQDQALQVKGHSILWPATISLLAIVGSVYLYLTIGSYDELAQSKIRHEQIEQQKQKFQEALTLLEQQVEKNPANSEMLFNLAHFYISAQQFDNAIAAFKKLITLEGEHAEFIGPQAQALYYKNQQQMTPEVEELIKRALKLDANDVSTLVLVGMDNFVNGDYEKAIVLWQRVINNRRPGTDIAALTNAVASAKERLLMAGGKIPEIPTADISTAGVSVNVTISDALKDKFTSQQTVFIYAIALDGPRVPLAAIKLNASELPIKVTLDDSKAMTPNAKISQHTNVRIFAVISQSGTPGIKPGDLHGSISNASLNAENAFELVIDSVAK